MNDPSKQPKAIQILEAARQWGQLYLWPIDIENVVDAVPIEPAPMSRRVDGVGMRTIQALEHFGFVAVKTVPVLEITAEGRAFLNRDPERPLAELAAELSAMVSSAPVGRFRTVQCDKCGRSIRIPSDIPGDWFLCAKCALEGPK